MTPITGDETELVASPVTLPAAAMRLRLHVVHATRVLVWRGSVCLFAFWFFLLRPVPPPLPPPQRRRGWYSRYCHVRLILRVLCRVVLLCVGIPN